MTTRRRSTLTPKPVVPADTIETTVEIDAVDEVAEVSKDMAVAALFVAIPPAPNCGEIAAVAKPEPRYLLRNSRHSAYIRG